METKRPERADNACGVPTLPGSIPGLLRRGSPVVGVHSGVRGVIGSDVDIHPERGPGCRVAEMLGLTFSWAPLSALALDLTDATGRAHAAWWLRRQPADRVPAAISVGEYLYSVGGIVSLVRDICDGKDVPDEDAEALRLVVLHVAGVTP